MKFRFQALPKEKFQSFMRLSDNELIHHKARWTTVRSEPGYPCRVSLIDAKIGERVLVIPFFHHDVKSPYRASGPIFVREFSKTKTHRINEIPKMFQHRQLSLRAYNSDNIMINASVTQGTELEKVICSLLKDNSVAYLHIHNASHGCFNCAVTRE